LLRRAVIKHQAPAIAFITGYELRVIGDGMSVGRVDGMALETGIRGDSPGFAARQRYREKIGIGGRGFRPVGNRSKAKLLGIGRKGDVLGIASLIGWHIIIRPGRKVARRTSRSSNHEQMAALAIAPMSPVTKQKVVIDARLHRSLFSRLIALMIAGVVMTIGINRRCEGDPLAIGRPLFIAGPG